MGLRKLWNGLEIRYLMRNKKIFIHKTACVDKGALIGENTKVWHFSHICKGAKIGKGCVIGQNCYVAGRAILGKNVHLQNNVSVYDLVTLEDNVFCGPSVVFTNDFNPRAKYPKGGKWIPTLIRQGASIGANATILCGISLGEHSLVGAGAVVTKDVPAFGKVCGVPARLTGWVCECGETIFFDRKGKGVCKKCFRNYRKKRDRVFSIHSDLKK